MQTRILSLLITYFTVISSIYSIDYYWNVSNGNYNNPSSWLDENGNPVGTSPTANDNVFITKVAGAIVNFPAGGIYYAKNLIVQDASLNFQGTNVSNVSFLIHGNIEFVSDVSTSYLTRFVNKWEIIGIPNSATTHLIDTKGIDLDDFTFNNEHVILSLKSPLTVSSTFRFYAGTLLAENQQILAGSIFIGFPGYNNTNAMAKEIFLDGSSITCTTQFYCKFNDPGVVEYFGNYTIYSPRYFLDEEVYDHLVLTNYDAPFNRDSLSMDVKNPTINHLEIDNDFLTRIGGSMTVSSLLEVNKPGKTIEFSTFENYALFNELTINGSVSLPNGGPCNQLTSFTIKNENDYFFKRNSGTVTFTGAFINNVKTTGGAIFRISNGMVVGSNTFWSILSNASPSTFYWVAGSGNWFDANHWSLESKVFNNPDGCIPGAKDNIIINEYSFNGSGQEIEMDFSKGTICHDFIWMENPFNGKVRFYKPFGYTKGVKPHVTTGSFIAGPNALFMSDLAAQLYQLWFSGEGLINIQNTLPGVYLYFKGNESIYELDHDLTLDEIFTFDGGTLNTNGHDITVRSFQGANGTKTFNLSSSHIESDSLLRFCSNEFSPTIINGTQASVKAKDLQHNTDFIKQIELTNNSSKNFSYDIFAEKVIFSGTGKTTISFDSLSVDSLVFINNAILEIGTNSGAGLRVNKGIRGPAGTNPEATILSTSGTIKMTLEAPRNICIRGNVAFEEVEALGGHVYHAEAGLDNGDNVGITFTPNTFNGNIFWNGYENEFHLLENWSNIPGGCATDISNIKNADSLIVDENGYNEDDTIFVNQNVSISNLVFRGEDKDLFIRIHSILSASTLSISDMKVEFLGDSQGMGTQQLVRVSKNLQIDNSGKFYFENLNMEMGNAYPNYNKPVIGLWNTGGFDPLIICRGNSTVKILGTSYDLRNSTVYFGPNTGANLSNADFIIENQSPYEMKFDFGNFKVNSFTIDTPADLKREYIFLSNLRSRTFNFDDGNIKINTGVELKTESF